MSRMEKFAADCDSVMVPYDPELLLYSVTRDMECYANLNRCFVNIRCAPCMMVFVLRM